MHPATQCVHAGTKVDPQVGGIVTPVHHSTSYRYPNDSGTVYYPRYFNIPTQQAVREKIAALENGEAALVLSSGMAAITTTLLAFLKQGDHAVFQADMYGGTQHFVSQELPRYGIEITWVDSTSTDAFSAAIRPNTRVLYFESPSNPLLKILDLRGLAAAARDRGVISVIDNTFATPINQRPLELGIDVVVHSGTKYLNGHSDVNCGAVVASRQLLDRVLPFAINHGGTLDVRGCSLLERGLKTLALRVERQNANAMTLARYLRQHPQIHRVFYPGLEEHPGHQIARVQMSGFGGMLAVDFALPEDEARRVVGHLKIVQSAISLGGIESLLCFPKETSHAKLPPEVRRQQGITDTLARISVGIEHIDDLIGDFEQAMR